jgi:hypothetical protein
MINVSVEKGVMTVIMVDWADLHQLTDVINETLGGK